MTVREPITQPITPEDRAAWSAASVRPLWEIEQAHTVVERDVRGTLWPWRTMGPLTRRALDLASPEVMERRVLSFIAPDAPPGEFHTITNLNAALQIIAPGERARAHRHTPDALRFVLDYGDIVLTPGNCWHEHWHEGSTPVVWLDVLHVHTHINIGTFVFEPGPPHDVSVLPADDEFRISGILPEVPATSYSPVFRFPLDSVVAALATAPLGPDGAKPKNGPGDRIPVQRNCKALLDQWLVCPRRWIDQHPAEAKKLPRRRRRSVMGDEASARVGVKYSSTSRRSTPRC